MGFVIRDNLTNLYYRENGPWTTFLHREDLMRVLIIGSLLIAAALGGWLVGHRGAERREPRPAQTTSTSVTADSLQSIRGLGKLLPSTGMIKVMAPPGERIHYVQPRSIGDTVTEGQPLFHLHSRVLRQRDLALARARRDDARRKAEMEKKRGEFQRETAQLAVDEAAAAHQKIAAERAKIQLLNSQLKTGQRLLDRLEALAGDPSTADLVNATDLDKQRLMVEQITLQIQQAETEIGLAQESAQRAQAMAQANLNTVEYSVAHADQAFPESTLNAAVELAEAALAMTEIRSPIDGQVLDMPVHEGDAATNQPVIVLGDTSQMDCIAEVNDSLLRHLDLQKYPSSLRARITSDALPEPIWGTVIAKGLMIGPPSLKDPNPFASVDRRTGTVTIRLDDPALAARFVNLQVDVEIEITPGTLTAE